VKSAWRAAPGHGPRTHRARDRVRAFYGGNYERLAELKNRYDPTNLFRINQNIAPLDG